MTPKSTNKPCPICGKKKQLKKNDEGIDSCAGCKQLADRIKDDPTVLQQLLQLSGAQVQQTAHTPYSDPELPDVLDGVRYRTSDRERNTWYISVSELKGNPVEIFASTAFENDQHLQSRISNLTTITRLISLILRHVFMGENLTLDKTLTQLKRSSRQPNDLPEMLGSILANYRTTDKYYEEEENYIP